VQSAGGTFTYTTEDNYTEVYDGEGRITSRTNVNGITWMFGSRIAFSQRDARVGTVDGSQNRAIFLSWDYTHSELPLGFCAEPGIIPTPIPPTSSARESIVSRRHRRPDPPAILR